MSEQYQQERELGWDDAIVKDDEFIVLPDGDYEFMVESVERARHAGSDNLPACNKAIVNIRIEGPTRQIVIKHNLFLHTKTEGMLSAFFASIGQKKKGEPLRMNWQIVPGSKGRCKLGHKLYNDNTYNEIKRFYPAANTGGYVPGQF